MTDQKKMACADYVINILSHMIDGKALRKKPDDLSFEEIYSIAKHHSLASTVFYYIEDEVKSGADERVFRAWEQERNIDFAKNIKQTDEFFKITKLLSEEKIPFLPMKGFMMKALYPRPELRTMADIDMYVSENDLPRIKSLLSERGYKDEGGDLVHDSMAKPPFVNIELHKTLYSNSDFSFENCVSKEDDPYWFVMRDEDFFIYMLRHAKKHYEAGGSGIRSVLDLYLYEKKKSGLDYGYITRILKDDDLYGFYLKMRSLADYWFGEGESTVDALELAEYTVLGGTYGSLSNAVGKDIKKKGKFRFVIGKIFPNPRIIMIRYKWVKKVPILLPIGYIVRIFQSVFNGRVKNHTDAIRSSERRKAEKEKNK